MKLVKSLLLGTAAAVFASAAVNAADLPAAEPAEYVKVCDAYGAGYFFVPGTDTCLKVGGYVRAHVSMTTNGYGSDVGGSVAGQTGLLNDAAGTQFDAVNFGTRGSLQFDARSRTDMGVLRSFVELATDNGYAGTNGIIVRHAFVQFAGITAGRTTSFFAGDIAPLALNDVTGDYSTRRDLIAYTANLGQGFSATLSLEDSDGFHSVTGATTGRVRMPEVVANLRVQQGWGAAWLSAVASQTNANVAGISNTGYAVSGGATLNLNQIAKGDKLFLKATYADGAPEYLYANNNVAYNVVGTTISKTTGYSIAGEYLHFWSPSVRSGLFANYVNMDRPVQAANNMLSSYLVGLNTVWSPVKNLDLGVEVFYTGGKFATSATLNETRDAWGGIVRVQRSF